jgi:hypothetical protein
LAGLAVSERYAEWSIIGGAMLVAGSLFLQSALSYWCMGCLKADAMILGGIITLSILETGKLRVVLRILSSAVAVMLLLSVIIHVNPAEVESAGYGMPVEGAGRYIAVALENRKASLDTAVKPVLFYSPSCGACTKAVEELARIDPQGERWIPVQVAGDPKKGAEFLQKKGYRGMGFSSDWPGAVPAMVTTMGDVSVKTSNTEEMLKIVRGEGGAIYSGEMGWKKKDEGL